MRRDLAACDSTRNEMSRLVEFSRHPESDSGEKSPSVDFSRHPESDSAKSRHRSTFSASGANLRPDRGSLA